jgi:hypothetical protein
MKRFIDDSAFAAACGAYGVAIVVVLGMFPEPCEGDSYCGIWRWLYDFQTLISTLLIGGGVAVFLEVRKSKERETEIKERAAAANFASDEDIWGRLLMIDQLCRALPDAPAEEAFNHTRGVLLREITQCMNDASGTLRAFEGLPIRHTLEARRKVNARINTLRGVHTLLEVADKKSVFGSNVSLRDWVRVIDRLEVLPPRELVREALQRHDTREG